MLIADKYTHTFPIVIKKSTTIDIFFPIITVVLRSEIII